MAKSNINISVNIDNAADLAANCRRLSELFGEAGSIFARLNSAAAPAIREAPAPKFVPGEHIEFGGLEWVMLDEVDGGVFCIAAKCITDGKTEEFPFDNENCNDWRVSSLRDYLNTVFLDRLGGSDNLIKQKLDLTADDGMRNYGITEDYIGLLSCDQYRKYRDFIPNYNCWWWTLTPWTCLVSCASGVRSVITSGAIYYNCAYNAYGVPPTCIIESDIYNATR